MKSAMCAASQLPGRGPTDVDFAPASARNQNPMMMMILYEDMFCVLISITSLE